MYCCCRRHGARWIECKKPTGFKFTEYQLTVFKEFSSKNIGIWVLNNYSESEIDKIHKPANWFVYLQASRGITLGKIKRIAKTGPEGEIQDAIIERLTTKCGCHDPANCMVHRYNNWYCIETYGSTFQTGLPDIYCCHKRFGGRWIECKNPKGYKFTPAQTDVFPHMAAEGVSIFVLTGSSDDELAKLFGRSNWHDYMWR